MAITSHKKTSTRAAASAGIVFLSQVVGFGIYFLAQRIIISGMTKDDFGSLALIQQVSSIILIMLVDAGLNTVAVREMIRRPEDKRQIVSSVIWLKLAGTIVASGIIASIIVFNGYARLEVAILAILSIVMSSRSSMLRYAIELPFRESMNFTFVSMLFVLDTILFLVLLMVYQAVLTPFLIFTLQLVSALPGFIIVAWRIDLLSVMFPLPGWMQVKKMLHDVRPLVSQLLLQNAHAGIDIFVLKFFAPLRELGVLGAVNNMSTIILTSYVALSTALYPLISEALHSNDGTGKYRVERTLHFIMFVCVSLACVLCVASPFIILVFTKNVYADNLLEFQMQFWCAAAVCLAQTGIVINSAQNEHRALFLSGGLLVVGSLTADFILIPPYFTAGLIAAKIWSNLLAASVSLWFIGRQLGFDLVRRFLMRLALFSLITIPYSFLVLRYINLPIAVAGALIVCFAAGWLTGFISMDEVNLMRKLGDKLLQRMGFNRNAQV